MAGKSDSAGRIAENRRARHDYFIEERFEAGIALQGWEVKSLRAGRLQLAESYVLLKGGEAWLFGAHVSPLLAASTQTQAEPTRSRKLLLHRQEIRKLIGKTVEKGMTLVPTRMYFKNGHVKVAISLAKGKKAHDKRETIKRRDAERETRAAVKERRGR